jgi:chromosome segregation ATPase
MLEYSIYLFVGVVLLFGAYSMYKTHNVAGAYLAVIAAAILSIFIKTKRSDTDLDKENAEIEKQIEKIDDDIKKKDEELKKIDEKVDNLKQKDSDLKTETDQNEKDITKKYEDQIIDIKNEGEKPIENPEQFIKDFIHNDSDSK